MKRLTKAQLKVLDAITLHLNKKKYAPSIREICEKIGLKSTNTVHTHLANLKKAGYVEWEEGQRRTLKVIKEVSEEDRTRLKPKFEYAY
jgi:repressor LexA